MEDALAAGLGGQGGAAEGDEAGDDVRHVAAAAAVRLLRVSHDQLLQHGDRAGDQADGGFDVGPEDHVADPVYGGEGEVVVSEGTIVGGSG